MLVVVLGVVIDNFIDSVGHAHGLINVRGVAVCVGPEPSALHDCAVFSALIVVRLVVRRVPICVMKLLSIVPDERALIVDVVGSNP